MKKTKNAITKLFITVICLSLLFGSAGCSKAEYHTITPEEAKTMMEESTDFVILDVRAESEFKRERIEGAILIPHDQIESRAKEELPDKKQLIFVYCRAGVRSENVSRALVGMGYTNVYDIGGILDWPFETVSG